MYLKASAVILFIPDIGFCPPSPKYQKPNGLLLQYNQFSIIISKLSFYSFTEDPVRTVFAVEENNKRMKINIEEKLLLNHSVLIILLILYNFLWVLYLTFPNRLVHMT